MNQKKTEKPTAEPLLLPVREVAAVTACKPATIYEWINTGRLSAVRIGRTLRVRRDVLDQFLREGSPRTAA